MAEEEQVVISSFEAATYEGGAVPAKPFYGMLDFQAQLVLPRSRNPPAEPVPGSVYQDEDDGRIYVWNPPIGWRASAVSAIAGPGIQVDYDEITQVSTISVKKPEKISLTITGDWTAGALPPIGWRTAAALINLQGIVTSSKPLAGSTITTLPVGWRPEQDFYAPCVAGSGQANVCVYADGRVVNINGSGQPLRLGGICFVAAQ